MLATQRARKTREYPGPTPHSVAIRAKVPTGKLPEQLIIDNRKKEDKRAEAVQVTDYHKRMDLVGNWEKQTDTMLMKNKINRRVRHAMEESKLNLNDRRAKLRLLLAEEEEEYISEMEAKQETIEERQKKMVERAKMLKQKREAERLLIVEDKLDQQFRDQCEELRSIQSRRQQDEVCIDRVEQIAIKAELERKRQEEEEMYAQLWEKDRLAKAAREEKEAQQQIERNRGMVEILRTQTAALAAKQHEEKRLKDEEAKLLKEERELRQMEEDRSLQYKREMQREHRNDLDKSVKLKMKRETLERQEELALDMKILEQLLEESRNEADESLQRRMQRKDEVQKYRKFLQEQMEEEKRRAKELDRLVDREMAAMWAKRLQQWRLEKEARHRLLQDVMETRRKQLEEKLQRVAIEREELKRDREELFRSIEEHNRMEDERIARVKQTNKNYESDLLAQMEHLKSLKMAEKEEEKREHKEGMKTEAAYQEKLKQVLSNASAHQRTHPLRRKYMNQPEFEVVGSKVK